MDVIRKKGWSLLQRHRYSTITASNLIVLLPANGEFRGSRVLNLVYPDISSKDDWESFPSSSVYSSKNIWVVGRGAIDRIYQSFNCYPQQNAISSQRPALNH